MSFLFRLPWILPALAVLLQACGAARPRAAFDPKIAPPPPNYADLSVWAAHPLKSDAADRSPNPRTPEPPAGDRVDVFFLYPTTYTGARRAERYWNAAADDAAVNRKTDSTTILYQATIFNNAGRVFAPRYRQAHLHSFYGKDKTSAAQALDLAYADVRTAFLFYLEHWNEGRPFILAGHSQGARHGMYLIRELIENTPLEKQLVAAYLVGWPVADTFFRKVSPCKTPQETGCFCSWRTFERAFGQRHAFQPDIVCTNPLIWTTEENVYAPKTMNRGAILRKFGVSYPQVCDAEVYRGILLCSKPKFPGSFFFRRKNYHVGDLNLYYFNVRENARERAEAFFKTE